VLSSQINDPTSFLYRFESIGSDESKADNLALGSIGEEVGHASSIINASNSSVTAPLRKYKTKSKTYKILSIQGGWKEKSVMNHNGGV